jgi:hypothetical protein
VSSDDPDARGKTKTIFGRVPEQIRRLAVVVAVLVVAVIGLRYYIIPPSLIESRLHRQSTVERETSKTIKFASAGTCGDCHDDVSKKKSAGFHKTLSCETCHGPALKHTENPDVKPFAPRERKFCPACHAYDPSRPTGFPQINPTLHNPLKPCITCHNPHDPEPPRIPRECSACHAGLARIKAVSPHALIECTTCHTVPERHKQSPQSVRPTKPETREFCGQCHGKESKRADAPKVDLSTHGERYLCWQCHYPHLPGRT